MPELSFYERQHIQKILIQQGAIGNIFNQFSREISGYLRKWTETGKPNVWARNSSVEKGIDRSLLNLQKSLLDNIQSFGVDAWQRGQVKNDDLVEHYIKGMSISSVVKDGMFYRNQEALKAYQNRVDNGMNLSDRVWKAVEITKDQVELFLGSGLSVGRAAGEISSDVRQLLKNPEKRFRRVRDKNGKLQLSTPMKDYHPGQGVYRSSYMNALRLSATNTNMNFRKADHDRWQNMDFVLGIEVKRSSSKREPCKICDALVGKYPKEFIFTGWHPFCICFAVPIMMDQDEFADYLLDDSRSSDKMITDIPSRARNFVSDNASSLNTTNFVRENKFYFDGLNQGFPKIIKQELKSDFYLSNGTGANDEKYKREAVVYTNQNGIEFVYPKAYKKSNQHISIDTIDRVCGALPNYLQKSISQIHLVDYVNPQDAYWGKVYNIKDFKSYASGGKKITFYKNEECPSDDWLLETLRHEIGHTIDQAFGNISETEAWKDVVKLDGKGFVSDYAKSSNSYKEDFAESFDLFHKDQIEFSKSFPKRSRLLESVVNSIKDQQRSP